MRYQPAQYRASAVLDRAIWRSPLSGPELAFHSKLTASRISELLRSDTFGDARRLKVQIPADLVGVAADRAIVRVR